MKLMYSDVLKEVQPSAILYSPSGTKVTRASILGELVPEIVTGLIWKVDSYVADCGISYVLFCQLNGINLSITEY